MATYSALPATLNLVATVGNDFTLSLTVTENGSPWVATGATLATDIIDSSGTVVATDFTTAASTGTVSLSLTDTQTTTLGVGVYSYRLSVTKSSLTRDWIAGTLSIVEAGQGGSSTSSASLAISNSAVSLSLTSLVAPLAENISVADADGFYTGDTVEEVLAEIPVTRYPGSFKPVARGAVCFTFDDGYPSWASVIQPALNPGQRCTFFITTNNIGAGLGVSAATLTSLVAAGHELGAHSTNHTSYTSLTAAQRNTDHNTSVSTLEAFVGAGNVRSFAYPSGARNATTDIECLWRYDRIANIASGTYQSSAMELPGQFLYNRQSWLQTSHNEVLGLIRMAAREPVTVVIYCHDPTNTSGSFSTDPTALQIAEAFDLCASLGVPMVTFAEGCNRAPHGLINGGFEDGLAGWSVTNSAAYTVEVLTDTPSDGLPGTKSLHMLTSGATTCFVEQKIPVIPSTPFNFSYRYRNISGATGHAHQLVEYDYTGGIITTTTSGAQTAATWTLSNRDVTLTSTTVAVGLRFLNNGGAAEWYIDHVHAGYQAWGKFG